MSLQSIKSRLEAINLSGDFEGEVYEFSDELYAIADAIAADPEGYKAIPLVFDLFEKNPEKYFGSPGPLVHAIEKSCGDDHIDDYINELMMSLDRIPTALTIWLLNRVINWEEDIVTKRCFMDKMREVSDNEKTLPSAREEAIDFLAYQEEQLRQ